MRYLVVSGLVMGICGCGGTLPMLAHGKPAAYWVQALHDPDAQLRKRAVEVLGNVGTADPAVVPALTSALKDRDAHVRRAAVLALLRLGPAAQEADAALREAQHDKDAQVRASAVKALRRVQGD